MFSYNIMEVNICIAFALHSKKANHRKALKHSEVSRMCYYRRIVDLKLQVQWRPQKSEDGVGFRSSPNNSPWWVWRGYTQCPCWPDTVPWPSGQVFYAAWDLDRFVPQLHAASQGWQTAVAAGTQTAHLLHPLSQFAGWHQPANV